MKKSTKMSKRFVAIFMVMIFSINTFGAIVSDNDGSAFITKAEFDSLKSNFQAQIDNYNTSIDSKIDGAIAAYLAGVKISQNQSKNPLFLSIYGKNPTFHNNDSYNKTEYKNNKIYGSYNFKIKFYFLSYYYQSYGGRLDESRWEFPPAEFLVIHKCTWDNEKNLWKLNSVANNAKITWSWVKTYGSYHLADSYRYLYWALPSKKDYTNVSPSGSVSFSDSRCWQSTTKYSNKSYNDIIVESRPSWATADWGHNLRCDASLWTEIDDANYKTTIEHLYNYNQNGVIERKIDLSIDYGNYVSYEPIPDAKVSTRTEVGSVVGNYDKTALPSNKAFEFQTVYACAFHGWSGNSTYNEIRKKAQLKPSEVYYVIEDGVKEPIELTLYQAPLFDRIEKNTNEIKFEITLSKDNGYSDADIYFSKKTWANDNRVPDEKDRISLYKNNSQEGVKSTKLKAGEKTVISLKNLEKDDLLYFSLVPENGKKAKIETFENCYYTYAE